MNRFLSRMIPVLAVLVLCGSALADTATGKIKSVSADKNAFVLTDKDFKDWTIEMSDTGKIRLNDKDSKLNDLKVGDKVEVTYKKVGDKLIASEVTCKRD